MAGCHLVVSLLYGSSVAGIRSILDPWLVCATALHLGMIANPGTQSTALADCWGWGLGLRLEKNSFLLVYT